MNGAKLYVAMHRPYPAPSDDLYTALQVGAANRERFCAAADADGENISAKNGSFCELTGLYWIWKNADADTVGMVHYRRYFRDNVRNRDPWKRILGRGMLEALLKTVDVILPRERHYVIETNLSHYAHAHHLKDLLMARDCVSELNPSYLPAFNRVMRRTHGHRLNMMIMKKPVFDRYCAWLFGVLFLLENRLDTAGYTDYDRRVYGFIAERLLDVWILHNGMPYAELPIVNIEPVRWIPKGLRFLQRKFRARPGAY